MLGNEKFNYSNALPSIIRVSKSQKITWAGNVARTLKKENAYQVSVVNPNGRNHLDD